MSIRIRPACAADVGGIFHVRTTVHENALTMAQLAAMGITEDAVTDMIASAPCAWVATDDGNVVAFSMIDADAGSLFAAFVLPSHEGRGIGRLILEAAENALFAEHALCWLETGAATRAAGFYRRLGWTNPQDVGNGDIRLEKRRPPPAGR